MPPLAAEITPVRNNALGFEPDTFGCMTGGEGPAGTHPVTVIAVAATAAGGDTGSGCARRCGEKKGSIGEIDMVREGDKIGALGDMS